MGLTFRPRLARAGARDYRRPTACLALGLAVFGAAATVPAVAQQNLTPAPPAQPVFGLFGPPPVQLPLVPVQPPPAAPPPSPCTFGAVSSPDDIKALIVKIASEEQFPADLPLAVAWQESRFHMNWVSPAGAIGVMQLMPATAARFNVNICDESDNIRGGIRFLRVLQEKYQNPLYMLAAYNAGEDVVDRGHGIPAYKETVGFVAAIMTDLYHWKPFGAKGAAHRDPGAATPADQPTVAAAPAEKKKEEWTQGFVMHLEEQ